MSTNPEIVLLTISDMVAQSIQEKRLHEDYPVLLDMCRQYKLSSYALHQIINQELVRTEQQTRIGAKGIGWINIADLEQPTTKPATPIAVNTEGVIPTRPSFFRRLTCFIKWLFILAAIGALVGTHIVIMDKAKKLNRQNSEMRGSLYKIENELRGYKGFQFADWTSKNHNHSSSDQVAYEFHADAGDVLNAECYADCEANNYDYLKVTLSNGGSVDETLAFLSGPDQTQSISYTFPKTDFYVLKFKYYKDSSVNKFSDQASVSNIFIKSDKITTAKAISQQ